MQLDIKCRHDKSQTATQDETLYSYARQYIVTELRFGSLLPQVLLLDSKYGTSLPIITLTARERAKCFLNCHAACVIDAHLYVCIEGGKFPNQNLATLRCLSPKRRRNHKSCLNVGCLLAVTDCC